MIVTLADVQAAAARIRSGIYYSPCPHSIPLSLATGMEVFCKLDHLQRTGSFKERGARNALLQLPKDQQKRGVIAASAGNHALGISYHGQMLGIPITVVMPKQAPLVKLRLCHEMGARVLFHGTNVEEAREHALGLVESEGLTYVHGYDDPAVIAGQGTLALEILEQVPDLEAIVVPVGGGGLIAGIALTLKALRPEVRVVAVQPETIASFDSALRSGHPVRVPIKPTLADGLAVPKVGSNAFALAKDCIDDHVLVAESDIALAVLRLLELEKSVVEGAAAISLGACLAGLLPELKGKKVVLPLTGGNIDTNLVGRLVERGLVADGRICRFHVLLKDRPGGLAQLATLIADEGANVVEIDHDRAFVDGDISQVAVRCVLETRDRAHMERLRQRLTGEGLEVIFPDL